MEGGRALDDIDFDAMNEQMGALYRCMWGGETFDFPVERTGNSPNSYRFTQVSDRDVDLCADRLMELFGVVGEEDREQFRRKCAESCSGSGTELRRISTLHSSALCALLFFYRVSEKHPCRLLIEKKGYTFTDSCLEYKNPVIRNPSNIDIVLLGVEDDSGDPVVLFLESKFSEYYCDRDQAERREDISGAYLKPCCYGSVPYSRDRLARMGLGRTEPDTRNKFALYAEDGKPCYLEGIKQMISHYVGVRNRVESPRRLPQKNPAIAKAIEGGAKVLLGTILFPLPPKLKEARDCRDAYEKKYAVLADILNEQLQDSPITVLGELLSYDQLCWADGGPEKKIRQFYFGSRPV